MEHISTCKKNGVIFHDIGKFDPCQTASGTFAKRREGDILYSDMLQPWGTMQQRTRETEIVRHWSSWPRTVYEH
ncbi:hypothetical protein PC116_g26961 [Phytophthora cactorum]|nr:hypothetical protein PC119_g19368 [Phytophthora cactorum]KAG4224587.1 hypothetical protein PC116_g26961 [Phytophthora cactorum]